MGPVEPALAELATLQRAHLRLSDGAVGPLLTLDPKRELATTLPDLGARIMGDRADAPVGLAFADGLARFAEAELDAFPGNLFWDFDALAASVWDDAMAAADPVEVCRDRFGRLCALQRLYGRHTAIRFRYVHDFIYGYDWAKWVRREPRVHEDPPGPYSASFLDYMHRRGHELIDLIDRDDAKYPRLPDDKPRNPFPFSREPPDEIRLHRELARRGDVPVEVWQLRPQPLWNRDYAGLREACAAE